MKILGSQWLFFITLVAFTWQLFKYWNIISKNPKNVKFVLIGLRTISLGFILLLILNPWIEFNKSEIKPPTVSVYIDTSQSVGDQISSLNESFNRLITKINRWGSKNFAELSWYSFGDTVENISSLDKISFNGEFTNFTELISFINFEQNKDAIIISDGVVTQGTTVQNSKVETTKIHTIGIGVENTQNDLEILQVKYPKHIVQGDSFKISLKINSNLDSTLHTKITVQNNNNENIYSVPLQLEKGNSIYEHDIEIQPLKITEKFKVTLGPFPNEVNVLNNSVAGELDISSESEKIILISGALSPNTSWIKKQLNTLPNSELNHYYRLSSSRWDEEPIIGENHNIKMIILDDYPNKLTDEILITKIFKLNEKKNIPIAYFEGPSLNLNAIQNLLNKLELNIKVENSDIEHSLDLNTFNNMYENNFIPPTFRSFYLTSIGNNSVQLKYDDEGVAIAKQNKILGVFIPEISKIQLQINQKPHSEILTNILIPILNEMYIGKDNIVQLFVDTKTGVLGKPIEVKVKLNSPQDVKSVNILVNPKNLQLFEIKCNKNETDVYFTSFTPEKSDEYRLSSRVTMVDGTILTSQEKIINIESTNLEQKLIYLDKIALSELSRNSLGTYVHGNELDSLLEKLNPQTQKVNKDVHLSALTLQNYWWILILLFSIEWFIRKKEGLL